MNRGRVLLGAAAMMAANWAGAQTVGPALPSMAKVAAVISRCVSCHGDKTPSGGLRLTGRAAALKGGVSGAAFVAGMPDQSLLIRRVTAGQMPPGGPLKSSEIETLRQWIASGAEWSASFAPKPNRAGLDWWSLQKPVRVPPPKPKHGLLVRNPIDAFVLAELEQHHLSLSPPADRATLLRRVSYDLTGMPPTPNELDVFLRDKSPSAYEKTVDRLLASPRYGEHWGRHWLDVVRFAESEGFERDSIRDHAWRYRDYVICSLNADKPYAQFVREQIAGDAFVPASQDGIAATGFLVAGPWDQVGNLVASGSILRKQVREEELEEMTGTVGQTFLGMTVNCARCHDHKFDPIPQRDYYRLKAALEGVKAGDRPLLNATDNLAHEKLISQLRSDINGREVEIEKIQQTGAERAGAEPQSGAPSTVPLPIAKWTFETDANDSIGGLHGKLFGAATIAHGRLQLDGRGAYLQTDPLPRALHEKTLEAWVCLPDRAQRGGAVISIETPQGAMFDAIVFGERETGKWIAGSEFFHRSRDLEEPVEKSPPQSLVHIAAVYARDNTIRFYRNGVPYGKAYLPTGDTPELATFPAGGAHLLFGLRHTGSGNGLLTGEIEEARLYDRALGAEEVSASYRAGFSHISPEKLLAALTAEERGRLEMLRKERDALHDRLAHEEPAPLSYAVNSFQPGPSFLLVRGDVQQQGETVTAGGLTCIRSEPSDFALPANAPEAQRRLRLADWIASPENPLTARVMVNRIWHYHFGRGLVATPNDFGFNGERPTHPALLDWLATEFQRQSGRWKPLHRLILLSNTYCQSSRFDAQAAAIDADDRLLWRFAPRRLEAEAVRDAMLSVSGQLNPLMGGPSFRPFTVVHNNSFFYTPTDSPDPEFNRRTVYRINVNSAKSPLLEALDCPDPSTRTPRRTVTTTPLQALELMNSSFVLRQARCFAERVRAEAGASPAAQCVRAYRLAFGRLPTAAETERASAFVRQSGLPDLCWALLNSSEFLYVR